MENNTLLDVRQLARRLGVSASWLRRECAAGRLPCLHAGARTFLFHWPSVESALADRARIRRETGQEVQHDCD